jgi:hypothetical protein
MRQPVSRTGVGLLASVLCSVSFADEVDMARGIGDAMGEDVYREELADEAVFAGFVKSPDYVAWIDARDTGGR